MVKFFNNKDEQGVETGSSVVNSASQAVKSTAKSVVSQFDIVSYLYGKPTQQEEQDANQDPAVTKIMMQYGKANASLKAGVNLRNPIIAQAMWQRREELSKSKAPEKVSELEILRKRLHDMQEEGILQPTPEQPEERIADKIAREEEEKIAKKQERKVEEVKKKEDLAVVQKRTSIEREKGWGAG